MALVNIRNSQIYFPVRAPLYSLLGISGVTSSSKLFTSSLLMNDASDDGHMVGHLRWADGGSAKTVNTIHLVCATPTSPIGTLRVGIQNVLTGVNNKRGDGTFDRAGTIDPSTFSANTKFSVSMNTGATTYSDGDLISVSMVWDSWTSGSFDIRSFNRVIDTTQLPSMALNTIGDANLPCVLLEASDGTFGILEGAGFAVTDSHQSFLSGDTWNEYGNRIVMPFDCKVNGLWYRKSIANTTDNPMYIGLFSSDGSSIYNRLLASDEYNSDTGEYRLDRFAIPEQTLAAGSTYFVSLRANHATNATGLELVDIGTAGYGAVLPGGTDCYAVRRNGGTGSFTTESTNKNFTCGLLISAIDDGAGGAAGGLITHPGMSGGMRA